MTKGFARAVGLNSQTGGMFYILTPLGIALSNAAIMLLKELAPIEKDVQEIEFRTSVNK